MKPSSSEMTRQKLLNVATDIFAEVGYKAATVREIVKRAEVNQAAINYHFRGKDALYYEVMKQAYAQVSAFNAANTDTEATAPEQRLRAFIHSMLAPAADAEDPFHTFRRLLAWEMIDPSGLLDSFNKEGPVRHHAMIMEIVRDFMPKDTPDYQLSWAAFWLLGQCSILQHTQNIMPQMPQDLAYAMEQNKSGLADFLTQLALNGLKNFTQVRPPAH